MSSETIRQATDPGHAPGSAGYRRVMLSMFAAGLATFVLLYSTQALLPAFVTEFSVTPTASTLTVSLTTAALAVALLVAGPLSEVVGRT
ncbi:MAG TPA: MFS transporter, partial [Nocardioides sp.]